MITHPLSGHRASSSSISMSTSSCWIMWSFRGRGAGTSCRLPPRLCGFSKGPGNQFKILKNLHKISWAFSLYKPTGFNLYTFFYEKCYWQQSCRFWQCRLSKISIKSFACTCSTNLMWKQCQISNVPICYSPFASSCFNHFGTSFFFFRSLNYNSKET